MKQQQRFARIIGALMLVSLSYLYVNIGNLPFIKEFRTYQSDAISSLLVTETNNNDNDHNAPTESTTPSTKSPLQTTVLRVTPKTPTTSIATRPSLSFKHSKSGENSSYVLVTTDDNAHNKTAIPSAVASPVLSTASPVQTAALRVIPKSTTTPSSTRPSLLAKRTPRLPPVQPHGLAPLLKRRTDNQIKNYFKMHPLTQQQIPNLFPTIDILYFDTVAIYSKRNWLKLRQMLTASNVTLFVNAGSSMTGAGFRTIHEEGCQYKFARLFHNMTVVDRAHGDRGSFHGAQFMHTFFPEQVDVVLWEFAINDFPRHVPDTTDHPSVCHSSLFLYMEQLVRVAKQRQQEPPIVILLYLWDMPFQVVNGTIPEVVYHSQQELVRKYDFIAGHINAGKYFESWKIDQLKTKAIALADDRHPNYRGHQIISYLMEDFIMNEKRPVKPKALQSKPPEITWTCAEQTPQQEAVRDLLARRYPIASYTEEIPKNKKLLHGMIVPRSNVTLKRRKHANQDPLRRDRKFCLILPCCKTAKSNVTFQVSQYGPLQGIQVYIAPVSANGTTVFFDHENVTDKLITARAWPCTQRGRWSEQYYEWLILDEERNVTEISFCSHAPACGKGPITYRDMGLISLVLYGGK